MSRQSIRIEGRTPSWSWSIWRQSTCLIWWTPNPIDQKIRTATWTISRLSGACPRERVRSPRHQAGQHLGLSRKASAASQTGDFGLAKMYADAGLRGLTNERSVRGTVSTWHIARTIADSRGAGTSRRRLFLWCLSVPFGYRQLAKRGVSSGRNLWREFARPNSQKFYARVLQKSLQLVPNQRVQNSNPAGMHHCTN